MMEWLDVLKEMVDDALEAQAEKETDGTKHPWTKQEDELLKKLIDKYGAKDWSTLATGVRFTACATPQPTPHRLLATVITSSGTFILTYCSLCADQRAEGQAVPRALEEPSRLVRQKAPVVE